MSLKFKDSFAVALKGIALGFKTEANIRREIFLGLLALAISALVKVSTTELAIIIAFIGFVLCAEYLNTGLEWFIDEYHPQHSEFAAYVKDISAGAVLLASISALAGALVIWIPRVLLLAQTNFRLGQDQVFYALAALAGVGVLYMLHILNPLVKKPEYRDIDGKG